MDCTAFNHFVKNTFQKYTENHKAPNPSLLRSIFTTWLYSLRYDTEDSFLQQIKSSSAKWKAHSEQIAATVYNKELVYQKKEFSQLLHFCEVYAEQFSPQRNTSSQQAPQKEESDDSQRKSRKKRKQPQSLSTKSRSKQQQQPLSVSTIEMTDKEYIVEKLVNIRVNNEGEKQVSVKWQGYRHPTWEPYSAIQNQLPELMAKLEQELLDLEEEQNQRQKSESNTVPDNDHDQIVTTFLTAYITEHHITAKYRWSPNQLNALEYASINYHLPINETTDKLKKKIMHLVRQQC
jgi:Chromo (CHRromatin Organisation MOdifier) domain